VLLTDDQADQIRCGPEKGLRGPILLLDDREERRQRERADGRASDPAAAPHKK
jgi:hypothetical protein